MKYIESAFDIIYLLFAVCAGAAILLRRRDRAGRLMGFAALVLGCGDAFHLVPRVLNYFVDADFTAWLGIGKFITSVTMTVFYLLMYRLWLSVYGEKETNGLTSFIYTLCAARVMICMLPQNGWFQNESTMTWGIIRNIPFVLLGAVIVCLFFQNRKENRIFRSVWFLVLSSFLFYIPVAVAAGAVPLLGMLMLPKTVCYMLLIAVFIKYSGCKPETKSKR